MVSAVSGGVPIWWTPGGTGTLVCMVLLGGPIPPLRTPFLAELTDLSPPDSWRGLTLRSDGVWVLDTTTGTDDAYPVPISGTDFTPNNTGSCIMREEPPGSGRFAFFPLQLADQTHIGFVSANQQTFGGIKTFADLVNFQSDAWCYSNLNMIGIITFAQTAHGAEVTLQGTGGVGTGDGMTVTFNSTVDGIFTIACPNGAVQVAYAVRNGSSTYTGIDVTTVVALTGGGNASLQFKGGIFVGYSQF